MSDELTIINPESDIVPLGALEVMQRAEIDTQIATAHRYPRSMQQFKKRAIEMATLDEETAASCIYSRPVGGGKFAEGLSVRTAEIVGASYGNLRVGAIIVEQTPRYVKCRGFAHDLESNFASACEVIEATIKKDGTPYDERMRIVIAKSCLAKARRDATFQVVPKALCKPIETAARAVAIGDATTLTKRREQVLTWIGKLGIEPARVFAAVNVKGADEIGLEELATLTGLKTSIKDGDVTVDEAFPAPGGSKTAAIGRIDKGDEKKPALTAEPTTETHAASLLSSLLAKAAAAKPKLSEKDLTSTLIAMRLMEPSEKLADLDEKRIANIVDAWDEGAVAEWIKENAK